ncbi:hypothetical protein N9A94_08960 [Akkermansiaceae bacterium]|jgi:hypothetical protein|nr:hypothetical protein [Akkermansiaceae bacterium]
MKLLKVIAVCLILPHAFVSCDTKSEDEPGAQGEGGASADSHQVVTAKYFGMMEDALSSLGAIDSKESADSFLVKTNEMAPELLNILSRAKALPEPSDEEKKAAQSLHAEVMARINNQQALNLELSKARELTPEAKTAIGSVRREVMEGNFGINMKVVSRQMDAIYGLKKY